MCDPAFCLSALRIMCTASHTYSVPFEPCVHSVCETGPASLRPLSCPALGPRVIDRPRDSGSGGFAPSSPAQPRVTRRSAPHHRELFDGWLFGEVEGRKKLAVGEILSPGGLVFFGVPGVDTWGYGGVYTGAASSILPRRARARASMWHAGPRIGDGYRKLSLTPTGVPNES